jgi:TPR repeat protein
MTQYLSVDRRLSAATLRKAAEMGHAEAMVRYGWLFYGGCGVAKDLAAAVEWCRKAKDLGCASGKAMFGHFLCYGAGGLAKDERVGAALARDAAESGCALGLWSWGLRLWNGEGVPKDEAAAVAYFRRGALAAASDLRCCGFTRRWCVRAGAGKQQIPPRRCMRRE